MNILAASVIVMLLCCQSRNSRTVGSRTVLISELPVRDQFLANVNSCSCLLYVVLRPSVVCLSVC